MRSVRIVTHSIYIITVESASRKLWKEIAQDKLDAADEDIFWVVVTTLIAMSREMEMKKKHGCRVYRSSSFW